MSQNNLIARLHKKKDKNGQPFLDMAACKAAFQLEEDFLRAGHVSGLTASWSADAGGQKSGRRAGNRQAILSDARLDAQDRFSAALTSMGEEYAGLLVDICCFHTSLSDIEKANDWPQRSGKLILKFALTKLANHYNLAEDTKPQTYRPLAHWGADGYKPWSV